MVILINKYNYTKKSQPSERIVIPDIVSSNSQSPSHPVVNNAGKIVPGSSYSHSSQKHNLNGKISNNSGEVHSDLELDEYAMAAEVNPMSRKEGEKAETVFV